MENKIEDIAPKKEVWIEALRVIGVLSVILIHTCATMTNNYNINELGAHAYFVLDELMLVCRFAVPIFIMISGYLLLNPQKDITAKKMFGYIRRMFLVLLVFAFPFAVIENVVQTKSFLVGGVFTAFIKMLEGKSWSHMWYVYTLVGLYIITPILRVFIASSDEKTQRIIIAALFVGNGIIPTVSALVQCDFDNYMLLNIYVMYYILGGYIHRDDNFFNGKEKIIYVFGILSLVISCISEIIYFILTQNLPEWNHKASNMFIPPLALAIFVFAKKHFDELRLNSKLYKVIASISSCSFAMYLIHPVFINLFYKFIHITPMKFYPFIFLGIIALFVIFSIVSYTVSWIMKRIPLLNKII